MQLLRSIGFWSAHEQPAMLAAAISTSFSEAIEVTFFAISFKMVDRSVCATTWFHLLIVIDKTLRITSLVP